MTLSLFLELHSRQRRPALHTYHYPVWSGGRDQPGSYFQLSTGPLFYQSHFKDPSLLSFPWNYCLPAVVESELPALLLLHTLNFFSLYFYFFFKYQTSKNVHLPERFLTKADVSQSFSLLLNLRYFRRVLRSCCSTWRGKTRAFLLPDYLAWCVCANLNSLKTTSSFPGFFVRF